jgi:hypothetical protein
VSREQDLAMGSEGMWEEERRNPCKWDFLKILLRDERGKFFNREGEKAGTSGTFFSSRDSALRYVPRPTTTTVAYTKLSYTGFLLSWPDNVDQFQGLFDFTPESSWKLKYFLKNAEINRKYFILRFHN